MIRLLLMAALIFTACTKKTETETRPAASEQAASAPKNPYACQTNAEECGAVDIEKPEAKESYKKGCDGKDSYGCEGETALKSKQGHHDGADYEALQEDIWRLEGRTDKLGNPK